MDENLLSEKDFHWKCHVVSDGGEGKEITPLPRLHHSRPNSSKSVFKLKLTVMLSPKSLLRSKRDQRSSSIALIISWGSSSRSLYKATLRIFGATLFFLKNLPLLIPGHWSGQIFTWNIQNRPRARMRGVRMDTKAHIIYPLTPHADDEGLNSFSNNRTRS